jgi:hypothetical protein
MFKSFCVLALLLTGVAQSSTERGFTSLFNGEDFTGWRLSKPESDAAVFADGELGRRGEDASRVGEALFRAADAALHQAKAAGRNQVWFDTSFRSSARQPAAVAAVRTTRATGAGPGRDRT